MTDELLRKTAIKLFEAILPAFGLLLMPCKSQADSLDWDGRGFIVSTIGAGQNHLIWKYAVLKSSVTGTTQVSTAPLNDQDESNLLTLTITTTGLNARAPYESLLPNTWYYIYLIGNSSSTAGLYSIHSPTDTAKISMPTGYSFFKYAGAVRTDINSSLIQSIKVGDETTWLSSPQLVLVSNPDSSAYATRYSVDITSGSPPITAWSVDVQTYTGPAYNVAGDRGIGISIGAKSTGLMTPCYQVRYQSGSNVPQEIVCTVYGVPVFNEGESTANQIDWAQLNETANRTSQFIYIYITHYREKTW